MSNPLVMLLSECFVRPHIEVDESKRFHHLNPLDLGWLSAESGTLGFLFAKPSTFSPSSYIERLRISLSQALVHFYPLAGRLVTVPNEADHSCCVYVDCAKGPGVRVISASARDVAMIDVLNLDSDVPEVVQYFFDLGEKTINFDGHTRALMSVQVTELNDGVFLGFCINHSLVDGISHMHFHRVWSSIFMTGALSSSIPVPVIKQPTFFEGHNFKFPCLDLSDAIRLSTAKRESKLSRRYFNFSRESLKKLKAIANSELNIKSGKVISTFQALIAFVWKCLTRVRNLPPDEQTFCDLPINIRSHFKPPLTDDYFGNYAVKVKGYANVGDLLHNSLGWAAMLLQEVIAAQDEKAALAYMSRALSRDGPELFQQTNAPQSNNVIVAGSSRFNTIEISEFGLGRLVAFRGAWVNESDGKIMAFSGSQGDGSVDLDIFLAPHTMVALSSDQEFMSFASQHNTHMNLISKL